MAVQIEMTHQQSRWEDEQIRETDNFDSVAAGYCGGFAGNFRIPDALSKCKKHDARTG